MPHYFDRAPEVASRPGRVELVLPDWRAQLATDRGVFSAGAVDAGTVELLKVPAPAPGDGSALLDLGCGYGPIALALAWRNPACAVWAVDVNERALDLAAANAAELHLDNMTVVPPSGVPSDLRFAQVWSNPPIRIGKPAMQDLLAAWLGRLCPGGEARLVAHKNLGSDSLARWLAGRGFAVERLASRKGYRILRAGAPL